MPNNATPNIENALTLNTWLSQLGSVNSATASSGLNGEISSSVSLGSAANNDWLNVFGIGAAKNNMGGAVYRDSMIGLVGDQISIGGQLQQAYQQEVSTYLGVKYQSSGALVTVPTAGIYDLTGSAVATVLLDQVVRLVSSATNDTIVTAGSDYVNAGAGDDVVRVQDLHFRTLDGGQGTDTLVLDADYAGASNIVLADFVSNARGVGSGSRSNVVSGWSKVNAGAAAAADTTVAPDGTTTADTLTLTDSTTDTDFYGRYTGLTEGQTYTFSIWVKLGTATNFDITLDIFRFISGESGADTVTDFTKSQGDKLDLSGILLGMGATADNIAGFVQLANAGSNAVIKIDIDGGANFGSPTQTITLTNAWTAGNLNDALTNLIDQRVLVI
ncbi:hypothetical protein CCZ27_09015 [Thauera sinica]|nr:hypothetical protein CCZ27_09015 [Thauera sp. K11]